MIDQSIKYPDVPMPPATAKAETRRRALIGAALREISDRGSLDVTVSQIATRAGVSSALAHHYFGGKEDLILATMRHLLAEFGEGVVCRLRLAEGPRARLSAIIAGSNPRYWSARRKLASPWYQRKPRIASGATGWIMPEFNTAGIVGQLS